MKALYIELAFLWTLAAAVNFAAYSTNGGWLCFVAGICSLLNVVVKVYLAGKEG